jgi:hypothetical protein
MHVVNFSAFDSIRGWGDCTFLYSSFVGDNVIGPGLMVLGDYYQKIVIWFLGLAIV